MTAWMHRRGETCCVRRVVEIVEPTRLILRPLDSDPSHAALYRALYGNPDVMKLVAATVPIERMHDSFVASVRASKAAPMFPSRWCVHVRQGGQGLGLLGANHDLALGEVEVGVLLLPMAQGNGFAREALTLLMAMIASQAAIRRFWSQHHPANLRMARVLERLEFMPASDGAGMARWERPAETASTR